MVIKSGRTGQDEQVQIVGVVGDIRHDGLNREPAPELFRPLTQTFMFPMAMVVRTAGPPEQIAAAVRQAAFEIDPVVPVAEMQPLTTMIAGTLGRPRLLSFLLTIFAAAGMGLGLIGVYGVVAYRVRQREREIGIRLALGARPSSMATRVVTQGVQHAIAGIAIGLPAAFLLSRVMSSMLFGVTTHDPLTFVALPVLIVAVTSAGMLPPRPARGPRRSGCGDKTELTGCPSIFVHGLRGFHGWSVEPPAPGSARRVLANEGRAEMSRSDCDQETHFRASFVRADRLRPSGGPTRVC